MGEKLEKHCIRCGLPRVFAGLRFDGDLCSICKRTPPIDELLKKRERIADDIREELEKAEGQGDYLCILALSGGKDSSYSLKYLSSFLGPRILAVTIDNGFVSEEAFKNCRLVTDALGVDHIIFKPNSKFMTGMYRTSVTSYDIHSPAARRRASSICNSCITLINVYVMNTAVRYGAPIIAGGYLGGQLPEGAGVMKIRPFGTSEKSEHATKKFIGHFGANAKRYLTTVIGDDDLELTVINPLIGKNISEDTIISELTEYGWSRPVDTGKTSTNCQLNDLGVFIHNKRYGYHPYAMEIADQVRHGLLSRAAGIEKMKTIPKKQDVKWLMDRLSLTDNEI